MKDINEEYQTLESLYLAGDRDILMRMFKFANKCLRSMITSYIYKNGIELPQEEIEERVENGSYWFLERYLKNPEFRCGKLTSYLPFAFKKAMFGQDVKDRDHARECEKEFLREYKKQYRISNGGYEVNYADVPTYIDVPCGTYSSTYRCTCCCLFSFECPLFAE